MTPIYLGTTDEVIIISRQKLLEAAKKLQREEGYRQPKALLADALFRWLEDETHDLVDNLADRLIDDVVDKDALKSLLEDLAERRGVEVAT